MAPEEVVEIWFLLAGVGLEVGMSKSLYVVEGHLKKWAAKVSDTFLYLRIRNNIFSRCILCGSRARKRFCTSKLYFRVSLLALYTVLDYFHLQKLRWLIGLRKCKTLFAYSVNQHVFDQCEYISQES